jgi:hypothetical protein
MPKGFCVSKVKGQIIIFHAMTFLSDQLLDCKIACAMIEHPTKQLISLDWPLRSAISSMRIDVYTITLPREITEGINSSREACYIMQLVGNPCR